MLGLTVGLAILGAFWGFMRLSAAVLSVSCGLLVGHWAGPALAELLFSPPASTAQRVLTAVGTGAVAALLVWLAAAGLRRALQALGFGWLDRVFGALATAALSLAMTALLLGLAAAGGFQVKGTLAPRLAGWGRWALELYRAEKSKANPQKSPSKPTSNGQQPTGS